jgi:hypothetical protein
MQPSSNGGDIEFATVHIRNHYERVSQNLPNMHAILTHNLTIPGKLSSSEGLLFAFCGM